MRNRKEKLIAEKTKTKEFYCNICKELTKEIITLENTRVVTGKECDMKLIPGHFQSNTTTKVCVNCGKTIRFGGGRRKRKTKKRRKSLRKKRTKKKARRKRKTKLRRKTKRRRRK